MPFSGAATSHQATRFNPRILSKWRSRLAKGKPC
jgi:hypothetical protein